ncbi:uncharacterized protein E0L32_010899 [Thyridium curvatum]|uniref:Zn(2)-C6 fungal-type domain-containing protein n=1 Tax=Thyridium curvatum TaxID=1093900 RepID=A0A507AL89_9PEZI|nr:uncharacterized protein E0L32_010899 [Thyridium curvatum]TPX07196.1 hypothetical protein E0L32_010899 [Thyridium curvatum]
MTESGLDRIHSSDGQASDPAVPIRRPRKQVSRACDWCRTRRIRCDNGQPCKACLRRHAECTREGVGPDEPRTLPQALREVDRLKSRIEELEHELLARQNLSQSQTSQLFALQTPGHSSTGSASTGLDCLAVSPRSSSALRSAETSTLASPLVTRPHWEGIHIAAARSNQASYYGPSSVFYFVSRIGDYLAKSLQQPFADRNMQPRGASRNMNLSTALEQDSGDADSLSGARPGTSLSRGQEEAFLRLFWEGYHCLMPIIDETEFRRHYASLWQPARQCRKPSALVDIVLALCLQYGHSFIPPDARSSGVIASLTGDATLAGRWHYRRAQSLITSDLESPSITTVQCYIFMSIYLCCATFHNSCHIIIGQAVRTAQIVGLHLEPPSSLPSGERELRKRIWWMLWTMDAKTSAKLGRPFVIDWAQVTVKQPLDDLATASFNGARLGSYGGSLTWLSYSLHLQKLFISMVDIHDCLFVSLGEAMQRKGLQSLYHDPEALESCAVIFATRIPTLTRSWKENVPAALKTPRRAGGEPMSTDRSAADLDELVPAWLSRQRLCLELMYHNVVINLTRTFITFYKHPSTYTPLTERLAATCVDHAIAFTLLMHQALTETDVMGGWSEYFSLQWNAAVTLVGFAMAYPLHQATPRVRQAVPKAIATFDIFGQNFNVSADAATITRDLTSKADLLASQLVGGIEIGGPTDDGESATLELSVNQNNLVRHDPGQQADDVQFSQFMDWAMSVDSYNSYDDLFNVGDKTEQWMLRN